MSLLLIRHTKPIVEKNICYGQLDIPLDINHYLIKRKKIYKTIKQLNLYWDWIYSSPSIRCKFLALYLVKKLSIPIFYHDFLKEFHYGKWEGLSYNKIENEFNKWANDYIYQSTPEGESLNSFLERIRNIYIFLIKQNKNIIIITHIGVIRGFYLFYHNLSIENYFDFNLDYGEMLLLN
ncbi:MAG: phosphoglycerate mutase [Leptospiraceae bacterium]|nr:MAG: phosphoglycerate mutase [Leptospiraceae bacterium]